MKIKKISLSTYNLSTLYTTLPHNLIKDINVLILLKKTFREKALFTLHATTDFFLLRKTLKNIMHDHVTMYVMR